MNPSEPSQTTPMERILRFFLVLVTAPHRHMALLSPLIPLLLHAQEPPVAAFVFRSSTPPPVSVEKFILPPLQELDASARVSVDGDMIKVRFDVHVTEAEVRQRINGTGAVVVGPALRPMERMEAPTSSAGGAMMQAGMSKEDWVLAHPHLYATGPADGTYAPQLPWAGITDPVELQAAKQAWMAEHALICPFAPSPRCTGTAGTHE